MQIFPNSTCLCLPVADGGDGTLAIIASVVEGQTQMQIVPGPCGKEVDASWFAMGDTAVIELAQASGIGLLNKSNELNAMRSNTYGTGVLIAKAFRSGFRKFILTVGGSASTDGGTGILGALGAKFLDQDKTVLEPCGASLARIAQIDLTGIEPDLFACQFTIACDVNNPLCGPNGAAFIFGPQKGASPAQVLELDQGLEHFGLLLNKDLMHFAGAGAAGGVPFALASVFGALIISGFDWISDLFKLEKHIADADIVITGEGALDEQSVHGKAVGKIIDLTAKYKKQLWIFPAQLNTDGYAFLTGKAQVYPVQNQVGQFVTLDDISNKVSTACLELKQELGLE